jgi:hypothetical protein
VLYFTGPHLINERNDEAGNAVKDNGILYTPLRVRSLPDKSMLHPSQKRRCSKSHIIWTERSPSVHSVQWAGQPQADRHFEMMMVERSHARSEVDVLRIQMAVDTGQRWQLAGRTWLGEMDRLN